ncbi:hypothetical protein [Streptomyces sp. NPDC088752]|uniref:hypothetical protein n=1 Tax=Streptomyces sp. NPDC088752 TaxID=3154963 RepID=UPI00341A7345
MTTPVRLPVSGRVPISFRGPGRSPDSCDLADFHWGHTDSHVYVEITCCARVIEVALGFRVRPTDAGWVVTGPATYW